MSTVPDPSNARKAVSAAVNRLWLPRLSLNACMRGVMTRDTRGVNLRPEQRLSYFPASPLCSISWRFHGSSYQVHGPFPEREARPDDQRTPLPMTVAFTGPFSAPSVGWNDGPAHGAMLLLMPDAVQLLIGVDPAQYMNRVVDVHDVLPAEWLAMCKAVAADPDDETRVHRMQDFLEPRWAAVRPKLALGGHRYQDWAQGLALRAANTAAGSSLRQFERRIKLWTGQPMRELQGLSKLERTFFASVAADHAGQLRWADLAADCGYADQSHLIRAVRRMTGFAPAELHKRIQNDEPFWAYRIWM